MRINVLPVSQPANQPESNENVLQIYGKKRTTKMRKKSREKRKPAWRNSTLGSALHKNEKKNQKKKKKKGILTVTIVTTISNNRKKNKMFAMEITNNKKIMATKKQKKKQKNSKNIKGKSLHFSRLVTV